MFERGKIILVPFPFTDLSSQKIRPAVIVSRVSKNGSDTIVAFISSIPFRASPSHVILPKTHADFKKTGLKTPSTIRCDKLATLDKTIVLGEVGSLSKKLIEQLNRALCHALSLSLS
ncbi:type II toxin-antitoxin system PemK/MazF family toxin [Candidatus Uhrbacteria bacterium]|nr:type II toxin-antitoxin system PemK/MazF family toxin [Candidatus Uhrbacteria bacterium]